MNEFRGLVDSHFHLLSLESRGLDPAACVTEFFDAGGVACLDVAVDTRDWDRRLSWGAEEPRVWYSAGIHPSEAKTTTEADLTALQNQLTHPKCLALGEVGLDWHRGRDDEREQRSLFRHQATLAASVGLPLIIHNRLADREVLEDLDAVGWAGQGIQHCFSSDRDFARAALDRGFLLSFAGNLTYPSSVVLREVAAWAPLDRILVETDAPYLPPQPVRGTPNRPVHAGLTAARIAEVRGLPGEAVLEATRVNFFRLFGLL